MEPGKPIVGTDTIVRLDRITKTAEIVFDYDLNDINGIASVYIIRNNSIRKLIERMPLRSDEKLDAENKSTRKTYRLTISKEEYFDRYKNTYPIFKVRIEMSDNIRIAAESNEFKVIIY